MEEVAAVLDDETRRIGEGHGIPKLSAEDINFALTELPQILDTDGNTKKLRREESILNDTGPDSAEKWKTWKMDDWLELYVKERTIWGSNTKLINSDYFAKDFWLSTGEFGSFPCGTITSKTCIALREGKKPVEGLSKEDLLRAYIVRVAIAKWQDNMSTAFDLLSFAATDSQLAIKNLRNMFTAPQATPPGDIMDVILPALGAIAVIFPAAAPVVAVVGGIATIAKLTSRHVLLEDEDMDLTVSNRTLSPSLEEIVNDHDHITEEFYDKRAQDLGARFAISTINDRVEKLEQKNIKSTLDNLKDNTKKGKDFVDNAAKVITGLKALNPGLPKVKVDSWDDFELRAQNLLSLYYESVESAFIKTKATYGPSYVQGDKNVATAGLSSVLQGGSLLDYDYTDTLISAQRRNIKTFFRKIILTQILKNQSVYFTRQYFPKKSECEGAVRDSNNKDYMDFSNSVCSPSKTKPGQWELRTARRPLLNDNKDRLYKDIHYIFISTATWVSRGRPYGNWGPKYYYQDISDFQKNSGSYPNLIGANMKNADIGMTFDDIFEAADECKASQGQDPFDKDWPAIADLYPSIQIESASITGTSSINPLCAFGIPVWDVFKASTNGWCRQNLREREVVKYLKGTDEDCGNYQKQIAQADAKMCGYYSDESREGCVTHDKGYYWWE
ncbi:hypothetical protein UCRPC4_g04520 [Phaeomoniella chlamydospora]|uniref:Uncharacterized protein n=1 Tax=Phaeomoniella chlamydospora TaxID=158046 RepID=A0A0G2GRE1_PHACM|nr:hypothetical protein UCRPC4_g04520 [Phaeomoniella chlamydospora]